MTVSKSAAAALTVFLLSTVSALGAPLDVPATKAAVDHLLDMTYPHLDALYKDIHTHPELGFQEVNTAAKLAKEMRALGFDVTEHVGRTGLVAIYKNGPGPLVMVRTELDALPMEEKTGLPYASRVTEMWNGKETFVDHSCGHDIHMASWVGTATALVAMKDKWSGTLMFIAQPSEETTGGAKAMLADGLFKRFGKPDMGFALHDGPMAYGEVHYRAGILSSNSDSLDVTFTGRGGHGSMPNVTIDPVLIASRFVVDVQSVISREKDPAAFGVVTIGAIHGGSAGNIIPDSVSLVGTIRSFDPAVRKKMLDGIVRTANAEAAMAGAPPPDVKIVEGGKAVINDQALADRTVPVFKAAFGDKAVAMPAPIYASEDYSEFIIAGVPSFFFEIGVYDPKRVAAAKAGGPPLPVNHSPLFAPVPEPTIRTGVEAMTLAVMNAMAR
ncbi:MAG TPA: amidohydrolase [Rhizomicrobium sp.]|nr:amidohydrolase [Rhizomicrobium sp.]